MSRLDDPGAPAVEESAAAPDATGRRALLLEAREVPLGGVRAMSVHRALPQRDLPMVGAWCFLDRFGPQDALMRVEPHPHIGLQTVTWPFVGEVRHRDAVGSDVVVRRGVLNLMTSGRGISHSEYSVGDGPVPLDALQLWVALPDGARDGGRGFERHEGLPELGLVDPSGVEAGTAVVVLGELAGVASPATAYTPIVGAEVRVRAGTTARIPLRAAWEHALVGVFGIADVALEDGAVAVPPQGLLYLGTDRTHVDVAAGAEDLTLFLLGGEPFPDEIVMWWNFVGRGHDEIEQARSEWEAGDPRFGTVVGHGAERIPAPPLPAVRLTPRRRRV